MAELAGAAAFFGGIGSLLGANADQKTAQGGMAKNDSTLRNRSDVNVVNNIYHNQVVDLVQDNHMVQDQDAKQQQQQRQQQAANAVAHAQARSTAKAQSISNAKKALQSRLDADEKLPVTAISAKEVQDLRDEVLELRQLLTTTARGVAHYFNNAPQILVSRAPTTKYSLVQQTHGDVPQLWPGLFGYFTLTEDRVCQVSYNVTFRFPSVIGHCMTSVFILNEEDVGITDKEHIMSREIIQSRRISNNREAELHTNVATVTVLVKAGKHMVQLRYQNSLQSAGHVRNSNDEYQWQINHLELVAL